MSAAIGAAPAAGESRIFWGEELLPEAWRDFAPAGPVRTFNPALLRDAPDRTGATSPKATEGAGWLFAYRIVAADGKRRIGLCRLDAALRPVPGSAVAFSDAVRFAAPERYPEIATQWFADPRLYWLGGRLFIYWNSGWHEPRNFQFLQELDPATLAPRGAPREFVRRAGQQKLEKNWTLFEAGGEVRAIYSIAPHRVLACSLAGEGELVFEEAAETMWTLRDYPGCHGGLRGGAPPQRAGGAFWSFCHSVHDGATGYRYAAAVYRFGTDAPFAPLSTPAAPLALPNPFGETRRHERLNPAVSEVIYPCGAARAGDRWIVSYGINDECCALAVLDAAAVAATQRPLAPEPPAAPPAP
jgi:hypothetical protein